MVDQSNMNMAGWQASDASTLLQNASEPRQLLVGRMERGARVDRLGSTGRASKSELLGSIPLVESPGQYAEAPLLDQGGVALGVVVFLYFGAKHVGHWTPAAAEGQASCLPGPLVNEVTYVRDGDTIEVAGVPIRLGGLAAQERDEPGGRSATAAMRKLVDGRDVRCELNGERRYDRCVGICYLDGNDIATELVRQGVARDYPRYSRGRYAPSRAPGSGRGRHDPRALPAGGLLSLKRQRRTRIAFNRTTR